MINSKTSATPGDTENILNNYRSVTYNFTLAAISPADLKNPQGYRNKKLKYVIASSKGKGANAISTDVVAVKVSLGSTPKDDDGNEIYKDVDASSDDEDVSLAVIAKKSQAGGKGVKKKTASKGGKTVSSSFPLCSVFITLHLFIRY